MQHQDIIFSITVLDLLRALERRIFGWAGTSLKHCSNDHGAQIGGGFAHWWHRRNPGDARFLRRAWNHFRHQND